MVAKTERWLLRLIEGCQDFVCDSDILSAPTLLHIPKTHVKLQNC